MLTIPATPDRSPSGEGPRAPTILRRAGTTILLLLAILIGSTLGGISPQWGASFGNWVDYTIVAMLTLILVSVRFDRLLIARQNLKLIITAWVINFIVVPMVGFAIAHTLLGGKPAFLIGLLIYFVAPCTDWFLAFTQLAGGNTSLGAALIPINMVSQLMLYPVYLFVFARKQTAIDFGSLPLTLLHWFAIPLVVAFAIRQLTRVLWGPATRDRLLGLIGKVIPLVLALLVIEIFAANISTIIDHTATFAVILAAVAVFFVVIFLIGELASKITKFSHPDHVLLAMTTSARNAPLMLSLTMIAIPDQPIIYSAIIIGMLVEFPHLTLLRQVLDRPTTTPNRQGRLRPHPHRSPKAANLPAQVEPAPGGHLPPEAIHR